MINGFLGNNMVQSYPCNFDLPGGTFMRGGKIITKLFYLVFNSQTQNKCE